MQLQGDIDQVLSAARNRRQYRRQPSAAVAAAPPGNDSAVLADLLVKATDKRSQEIDLGVLRRIKSLCRKSEEHVRAVHEYLLHALEANHAQVRYHAMEICDQLFQRSHLFRWLTTQHLPQILEHAVGTKASRPLPGPPNVATRLHEKALESIDQWADQYGAYYQQLRVTMRYLKDVLQMRFPQLRARAAAAEAEARARQARAQEILREKLTGIAETYDETSREIQSTLNQMDEAFELLMPTPDKTQPGKQGTAQDEEGLEWEDVAAGDAASDEDADEDDVEGLSEYRDTAVPEDLLGSTSVVQNPDVAVLETLTELNQLLGGAHMRTVNEWLRILTQVVTGESGSSEDREREQLLRRATGLRGSITRAQDRYGAVMDAFKTNEDITLGMGPTQQKAEGPLTGMQQGLKEPVPPWLTRQQPDLADLFGASSSEDDQAPEQAPKSADGNLDGANSDQAHTRAESLQASTKAATNGLTQSAVTAAGKVLRVSTQQPELPASSLGARREGSAPRPAKAAAETSAQRAQRIDYGAVAAQLKREPSDSAIPNRQLGSSQAVQPSRGLPGHEKARDDGGNGRLKKKAGSMTEQPAAMSLPPKSNTDKASQRLSSKQSRGATSGSTRSNAWAPVVSEGSDAEEGGDTPRFDIARTGPWEPNEDASRGTPGDTSADSDGPKPSSMGAEGRSAERHRKGSQKPVQANANADPERKKSSIPEVLKQALAAEAPLVPSGPHLAYWDSKDQALVNARGMQVYNHWGPVDEHKTLPTERLNELFGSMASYYKPPTKQEQQAAGKRKAEPGKSSFKDEPLEAQKPKRPKAPVTAILPPAIAQLVATSTSQAHVSSPAAPLVKVETQPPHAAGPTAAEPEQAALADQAGQNSPRAAYLWPSQAPLGDHHMRGNQEPDPGPRPNDKTAAGQDLEVEEVEWRPGEAAGASSGNAAEAMPTQIDQHRELTPAQTQARGGRARDPEKPSKGQRALDKAHNDAVLAEAATRDPILAHRWAAQQASKTEKTKKGQGAKKKLGVRASLAKKLLSKTAVMSAAHDMSAHEAEAHQDLNTNRWEEK